MPKHTCLEFVLGQVSGRGSWFAWLNCWHFLSLNLVFRFGKGEGRKHLTERTSILTLRMGNRADFQAEGNWLGLRIGFQCVPLSCFEGELKISFADGCDNEDQGLGSQI